MVTLRDVFDEDTKSHMRVKAEDTYTLTETATKLCFEVGVPRFDASSTNVVIARNDIVRRVVDTRLAGD